jgi:hypothetical protein
MALVVTGLAIGTGGGLSKLAVKPVGIGLVALFQPLAAGRMVARRMGGLKAHGNLRYLPPY